MHLHTLTLYTRDLAAQQEFYAHTLGFALEEETPGQVTFRTGASRLTFVADPEAAGFSHLAWDVSPQRLEEAGAWLRARVPLLADEAGETRFAPGERWNTTNLYFEDPDGNILEVLARHDFPGPASSPVPFGAADVLHLSEFGLVVPDVPAAVRDLGTRFGLFPFNGGGAGFTAVGGHDGMFIVVPQGRGWMPTGRPAVPAPFRATFRAGPHLHTLERAPRGPRMNLTPSTHIRLARPSLDLRAAERFYVEGAGLELLYRHESAGQEASLLMLGLPGAGWHLEPHAAPRTPAARANAR